MKVCSIPGCREPSRARGWCSMHYMRWQRLGNAEAPYVTQVPCALCGREIGRGKRRLSVRSTDLHERVGTIHPACWDALLRVVANRRHEALDARRASA